MLEGAGRSALTEAVYYILLSLYSGPIHGYGIMQQTEMMSGGRVLLGPGTLYGALNTLLEKHWIAAIDGDAASRKKLYGITRLGRDVLAGELLRLAELLETAAQVMGGEKREICEA